MAMRYLIAATALLLVAGGCSSKDGGGNSAAAAGSAQETAPENLTIDPTNSAVPVKLPSPAAIAAIPASFDGRWGTVADACNATAAGAAKGLMTIAGSRVTIDGSQGEVTDLKQPSPARLAFSLVLNGGGNRWTEPTRLTMEAGGRTLVRQVTGNSFHAGAFTYQRCPG